MKTLIAHLELSTHLHARVRDRCPNVVWRSGGDTIATIRTDVERPDLPLGDGAISLMEIRDDGLSRVMNEGAWLAECQRVLAVNGEIRFTLPASGPLAWLDGANLYRYLADISKRGDPPDSTLPTGWNRHYSPEDISLLLADAGFDAVKLRSANYAGQEIRSLVTLMGKNWVGGDRTAEYDHFPSFGKRAFGKHRFPIGTTWNISARKRR